MGVWPISRGELTILGIVSHVSPLSENTKKKPSLPNKNPFQENLAGFITKIDRSPQKISHTQKHPIFLGFFLICEPPSPKVLPQGKLHLPPSNSPNLPPPRPFSPYRVPSLVLALVPCDMSEDLALAPARSASHGRTWEPRGGGEVTTR